MTEQLLAGRYRLEREIGAGGMGRVWRARDVRLDREVAVKTVDLGGVNDPSLAGRFQREIVLTAKLTSPHTVTVFDGGVDGHTAYLVMELLRGESLAQAIDRRGPLGLTQTLDVARQVALGLGAAHSVGLVHRDIKPANVMLTEGRAKLLDFGIAQLTGQADPHLTAPSMTIGTAAYMSPEQAAGMAVDAATDVYALGCLIMTMLTGRPPFDGNQPVVVASQQINNTPPRLTQRRSEVPAALDDLVVRLLAKNPLDRPDIATTLRVLEALQANPSAPTVHLAAATSVPRMSAPPTAGPMAPTRAYTQAAPAARIPARTLANMPQPGPGWIAGVLISLMAALIVAGLAVNLTGTAVQQVARMFPTTASSPKASSNAPRPTPTPTRTASQGAGHSVAVSAAMQGVALALSLLPDSADKAELSQLWQATSANIQAGRNPRANLAVFEAAVRESDLAGWEQQAVLAATGPLKSLL